MRISEKWTVVVTTAPREEPTLHECIDSLQACGWDPVVFAEPGSEKTDCLTFENEQRKGVWHNWLASCRWALEQNTACVLTVQDDIVLHPQSRELIERIQWPSLAAFVSLYTAKHYQLKRPKAEEGDDDFGELLPNGLHRIVTGAFWGACAMAWAPGALRAVVESPIAEMWAGVPPPQKFERDATGRKFYKESKADYRARRAAWLQKRRDNPHMIQNSDTAIGKVVNGLGLQMFGFVPSPACHVAQFSSIGHGGNKGRRNALSVADPVGALWEQIFCQ